MRLKKALALIFAALALYLVFSAMFTIARALVLILEIWGLSPRILTEAADPFYGPFTLAVILPARVILQIILPVVIVVWKRQAIYSILRVD